MAENSNIEWTDHTFNAWRGCTKVSPACDHCYAETMSKRNPSVLGVWGKYGTREIAAESYWKKPLEWNRKAEREGVRRKVFCASLADVFEGPKSMPVEAVEAITYARLRLFELIEVTPHLDWLLLTKRPENVLPFLNEHADESVGLGPYKLPDNVWIGTTVENQKWADIRIPELLKVPAAVRFLSVEPMLGPVDLTRIPTGHWAYGHVDVMSGYLCGAEPDKMTDFDADPAGWTRKPVGEWERGPHGIDWVICGGESGAGARPLHPQWARDLRDQCVAAGVPFFFKQWGEWLPVENDNQGICGAPSKWTRVLLDGLHYTHNIAGRYGQDQLDWYGEISDENGRRHDERWKGNALISKVGKKRAGRLLDGRTWDEFPEVAA
jgi:protein gp37